MIKIIFNKMIKMKNLLLNTIVVFVLISTSSTTFAQINAFQDEVNQVKGIIYYNNEPFTGTLFSNDEQAVPNSCECTLKAHYQDGKLQGIKKQWYPSGKLKFKGNFDKGKPIGNHIELYETGSIKKEWEYASDGSYTQVGYDTDGNKISESFYDASTGEKIIKNYKNETLISQEKYVNHMAVSKTSYENGKPTEEKIFDRKHNIIKIFDEKGIPAIQKSYLKNTDIKDGKWIVYDEFGNIQLESIYKNGVQTQTLKYENGKKNGVEYVRNSINGDLTKNYYRNGKLITKNTIPNKYLINNYLNEIKNRSGIDKIIVKYHDDYFDDDKYYIIIYPNTSNKEKTTQLAIEQVVQYLLIRPTPVEKNEYDGEYLSGVLELNLNTNLEKTKYKWNKTVNKKPVSYTEWGYVYHIIYKIKVHDIENNNNKTFDYDVRTHSYGFKRSIATRLLYPKDQTEAFNMAFGRIYTYPTNAYVFPKIATISKIIKQSSKTVKKVKFDKGYEDRVLRKAIYYFIDEDKNENVPKLVVYKSTPNSADAKVKSNGKRLKEYMKHHQKVYVIERSN